MTSYRIPLAAAVTTVAAAAALVALRRRLLATRRRRLRLALHFDVNETIMVGDPAGGDTYEESLNKILAKSAFVRPAPGAPADAPLLERWVWHDGSPLDPTKRSSSSPKPPLLPEHTFDAPDGCTAFYKVPELKKAHARGFTDAASPGAIYSDELQRMRETLAWPAGAPVEPRLCEDGHQLLIPAFFHTLCELARSGRPYSLVVRTFGTDLPRVAQALEAFSEGKHPLFPDAPDMRLKPSRTWLGRFDAQGRFELRADGRPTVTDEQQALGLMLNDDDKPLACVAGVMDDYDWWKGHGYVPSSGKPLWLTLDVAGVTSRQLFFDDNIHNNPDDSIVAVRARTTAGAPFVPLSGAMTCAMHGTVLRRCPTMLPILDLDWFLREIEASGAALEAARASPLWEQLRAEVERGSG